MAFRNALPPREQALAELAMCDPADLSKVQKLRVIHSRCAQAGVLTGASVSSASATAHAASAAGDGASDVAKLHQLFDAAVANGMPQLVCHYVDEVCGHDDFSSPDGVEAYLQDGEMVAEWATSSLRSAEQALDQAAALRTQGAADEVDRAGAVFEALRDVLVALGADPAAGGDGAEAADAATGDGSSADGAHPGFQRRLQLAHDDAARRMQHAAALSWSLREGLIAGAAASQDRYGGTGSWASEVTVRRAAAAAAAADLPADADGGGLFLDDLLAGVGVHAPPYPFKSATEAAERVFRHGSAAPAALVAKQSLFLYYLLDAGLPPDGAPARFARHVRLHPRLFVETRCAALLDDHRGLVARAGVRPAPRRVAPRFALRFVATLAARGKPADALAVARAGGATSPRGSRAGPTHEWAGRRRGQVTRRRAARTATCRRDGGSGTRRRRSAECGLATEAFVCARDAVAAAPHASRRAVADKLVARLASHAAARGALESVLDLPFDGELEPALMSWLDSDAGTAAGAAEHLGVVYYLTRGRTTEAAARAAALAGGARALPADALAALAAAVRSMPESMQRLHLVGAAEARDEAGGGKRALARGLVVQPATPMDFAKTPRARSCPRRSRRPRAGCSAR